MMARLVIYGAGGFGREVWALVSGTRELAFCDDHRTEPLLGVEVIRPGDIRADDEIFIAAADPVSRRRIEARLIGHQFATIIAPSAFIASDVEYGPGAYFAQNSLAGPSARIGRQLLCHVYAYVGHENVIGDYVTVGPRASLNGNVTVGDGAYIGNGAMIRQGLAIGEGAVIGMGAVVVKDVAPYTTVAGNPARVLERSALRIARPEKAGFSDA
jgi:sugar O-acyltransferase (sialic acid O-acetyltransferase NeuD family)